MMFTRSGTLLLLGIATLAMAEEGILWREDGRCGEKNLLPDGKTPGQCNPDGNGPRQGPCCSPKGFCGNTVKHCECRGCVDFSKSEEINAMKNKKVTVEIASEKITEKKKTMKEDRKKEILDDQLKKDESELLLKEGVIVGNSVSNKKGLVYYEYRGIPYAKPPIGRLRFKPPVPAENVKGTFKATKDGPRCYQDDNKGNLIGSEDCLYLNIFTKTLPPKSSSLPVMVWIHGGGFVQGSGSDTSPEKLVGEGVIVVTLNYRLGGLGFLTFGNDKVSGNMGLRDQAAAIQWVKRNIEYFGGNPNKVTIFGGSAGGMSVHAQVLSPKNIDQLAGAIAQSGSMLYFGVLPSEGEREEQFAVNIAQKFNCSEELSQSSLFCLQQIDGTKLAVGLRRGMEAYINPDRRQGVWHPVVDNYASDPFMPLSPIEALKSGAFNNIPFMSGTVKNEGAFITGLLDLHGKKLNPKIWEKIGARLLFIASYTETEITEEQNMLANIIREYYSTPDKSFTDMFTDSGFVVPDQVTVKTMSQYNPMVFNYHFTQKTNHSLVGTALKLDYEDSPVHADEVLFLFDSQRISKKFSEEEKKTEKNMVKLWTNFAKYGNPTPSSQDLPNWNPINFKTDVMDYMELSSEPVLKNSLYPERMLLWDKLVWGPREQLVENMIVYSRATEFLLKQLSG